MKQGVTVAAVLVLGTLGVATAQARDAEDYSRKEVEKMIGRAEEKSDDFKKLTEKELNRSILEGTRIADSINREVQKLDEAIDRLKKKFDRDDKLKETREEAGDVYDASRAVERALEDVKRGSEIWEEWKPLKKEIETLADAYELSKKK